MLIIIHKNNIYIYIIYAFIQKLLLIIQKIINKIAKIF